MKDFFKMMFACLVALFVAGLASMLFVMVLFGALASAGGAKPVIAKNSVLVFDLSANIADAPSEAFSEELIAALAGGDAPPRLQLRKVIGAIDAAAGDERIKGLFLHGSVISANYGSGYAALMEVRAAIERFRATGKPVIAYVVTPSTRDYLLASAASRVVMNPMGLVGTPGMAAEVLYMGGTFQKYGIGIQIARAGEYKSAGEAFVQEHMSPAEREQLTALLGDVWSEFVSAVSRSRELPEGAFQAAIDNFGILSAEQALEAKLVDELGDMPAMIDELRKLTDTEAKAKTFRQIGLPSYIASREPQPGAAPPNSQVAVVYAEGDIVDGEGSATSVGGDRLARELRKLRRNERVKAVVLRVNSPGGSAIASEVIRRDLVLLQKEKPVVVSMGSLAASGGYWISTASNRIYAEPNTITGSIGVIAIMPNLQGLAERFALNVETVKTGRHADVFSLVKPRDPEAMRVIQGHVNSIYQDFLDRVVESRGLDRSVVESVAGGRVWSGADALEHGLVDEIGGLSEAIGHAAKLAQLSDYRVLDYPEPRPFLEVFLEKLEGRETPLASESTPSSRQFSPAEMRRRALGSQGASNSAAAEVRRYLGQGLSLLETLNDPQGIYARLPVFLEIK